LNVYYYRRWLCSSLSENDDMIVFFKAMIVLAEIESLKVRALYQKGLALAEIESLKVRAIGFFKAMIVHYQQLQYPFMQNRETPCR